MTDKERASALLALLKQSQFPGSAVDQVLDLRDWLQAMADGRTVVTPAGLPAKDA